MTPITDQELALFRRFIFEAAGITMSEQKKALVEGRLSKRLNLRSHVLFRQLNLNVPLPNIGKFDVVFLRNVMIYFSDDTKREVVARVISAV